MPLREKVDGPPPVATSGVCSGAGATVDAAGVGGAKDGFDAAGLLTILGVIVIFCLLTEHNWLCTSFMLSNVLGLL